MGEKTKAAHSATKAEQVQYRQYLEGKKGGKSRAVLSKTAGLRLLNAVDAADARAVHTAHERDAILGTLFRYGVCLKSLRGKELRACPEGTWLYPGAVMSTVEAGKRQVFCADCVQRKVYAVHDAHDAPSWQRAYEEFVKDKTSIFAGKAIALVARDAGRDRRFLDRRKRLAAMHVTEDMPAEKRSGLDRRRHDRRRACP